VKINTGLTVFSVQLQEIEDQLDSSALWAIVFFIAGLIAGFILGITWPSTH
jgi:hypothetical protein